MPMKWLEPDEEAKVFWKSSISQHKHMFSVMVRGEWVPIAFDNIDYIKCAPNCNPGCNKFEVAHHCATVTDGDDIGFDFNVGQTRFVSDSYISHDHNEVITKMLPCWFGMGTYQEYVDTRAMVNADNGAVGTRSTGVKRIGLAYALAKETLPSDDPE